MNRHPALVATGPHDLGRHYVLDVPPDLERLVPSGATGARVDVPYVNSGRLAMTAPGRELVEVWLPLDERAALHDAALRTRAQASPVENSVVAALESGEVTMMGPDGSTPEFDVFGVCPAGDTWTEEG